VDIVKGSVGVTRLTVGTGNVGVGTGRVGSDGDGVGTGSVGSDGVGIDGVGTGVPDPVGVGDVPEPLGLGAEDGLVLGRGEVARSREAAIVMSGDSGASCCGLSAR